MPRELSAASKFEHLPGGNGATVGFSHKLQVGFADINRDNFDHGVGDDPNFSTRGRSERLSYSLDWSALGGERMRLLAGAERGWTSTLTANALSRVAGRDRSTFYTVMLVGRPQSRLTVNARERNHNHHK